MNKWTVIILVLLSILLLLLFFYVALQIFVSCGDPVGEYGYPSYCHALG